MTILYFCVHRKAKISVFAFDAMAKKFDGRIENLRHGASLKLLADFGN